MTNDMMSRAEAAAHLRALANAASPAIHVRDGLAAAVLSRARRRTRLRRTAFGVGTSTVVLVTAAAGFLGRGDYFAQTEPSPVMSPAIGQGQKVLLNKTLTPVLNDVVLAHVTNGDADIELLSRVVATEGTTVSCPAKADGRCDAVLLNGEPANDTYLQSRETDPFPPTVVGAGEVFLLGDRRNVANDSRNFGTVPVAAIQGVVVAVINADESLQAVPGAPTHRLPDDEQVVDPANPVPPASTE